jgi:acyl-CoA synthetase (AMP-forming)/AMP-acid ligase II
MPEELIKKIFAIWPGVKMFNYYGLTEAGPGGTCLCIDGADFSKIKSVGLPWIPDQAIRVVDEEGRDVEVGQPGEIIVRGPNVMKGYYKNTAATEAVLKNGWLRTGDIGCFDNDRYLYYKDRQKDMVVRGGYNIFPTEVENVIYEHPCVSQCAVVGKPHKKLGEDLVAYVTLTKGMQVTVEELSRFCAERMADFKCPRDIRIVDSLPVSAAGKIDKVSLRIW